jgi:thiol-disulfide isomerase/thioredoxin
MFRLALLSLLVAGCATTAPSPSPAEVIDFTTWKVSDYDGNEHDLAAQLAQGEPVVLVFWQTWCLSCLAEAPALADAARENRDLHFYGVVSGDEATVDEAEVRAVAFQKAMPYAQILDRDLALTNAFGVMGTPTIVVVGAGGRVLHSGHDADVDWDQLAL